MSKDKLLSTDIGQRTLLGICLIIFLLIILFVFGYKLTDYYIFSLNDSNKSPKYWPNLLVFFEPTKDLEKELIRKQIANSHYTQKNPWTHLMLSKRIDTAIDEFCCLCLRDHVYPWLSLITQDDSVVYEAKYVFRFFLATVIRRIQN
ncbi:unnamed protein product [Rotaria sp. Silwood2]|nr:unnamed protein product [Rotaria sp. Silwood2]